jgi:hypothetical protein
VPEPFYKVVFEGARPEANPLRLSRPEPLELKVGDTIPVVLSFERFESDPRLRVAEIIGSIDDFAELDPTTRKRGSRISSGIGPPTQWGKS